MAVRKRHIAALLTATLLGVTIPLAPASADADSDSIVFYQAAAEAAPCSIDWAILGGIAGFVSDHGRINEPPPIPFSQIEAFENRTLPVQEPILGPLLDGLDGRSLVGDTDGGELDGDLGVDRAVGPFQFLPATWAAYATDADGDGIADPNNLDDSAAAAAALLCDVDVDTNSTRAITKYFGTDVWNSRVRREAARLRALARPAVQATQVLDLSATGEVDVLSVGGINVSIDVGEQVAAMLDAAAADGIALQGWGWRSHQRQIELRAAHCADIWTTPSSQCNPPTATPGHSRHEFGLAIDFFIGSGQSATALSSSSAEYLWLAEHAESYGFFNLPSEPWHWSVDGR